jgi:hypothetical protein
MKLKSEKSRFKGLEKDLTCANTELESAREHANALSIDIAEDKIRNDKLSINYEHRLQYVKEDFQRRLTMSEQVCI